MSKPIISSRFNGPSVRREVDGTFEAVLPELSLHEEQLQDALIAHAIPQNVYRRRFMSVGYPNARPLFAEDQHQQEAA